MARGKQAPAQREPEMCVVPPGAQPLLPAKLLPGMGITRDFPVTTTSEEARKFFLQGVSQIHSFWFQESERSCTQALELDPDMAMAHWCIALSAASDYRPAFQLLRDPGSPRNMPPRQPNVEAVARSTSGAAIDPQVRAREAIAKGMALRDKVTPRERLHIESQSARRAPGLKDAADAAYIATLRKLAAEHRRSRSEVDARAGARRRIRAGHEGAPRAHDGSHRAARRGRRKTTGSSARTITSSTPTKAARCPRRRGMQPALCRPRDEHPHALHMPGHIYAQSDKIQEAISAFSAAAANEQKWIASDTLYPTGHWATTSTS
jgi:hypothetical protein